MLEWLLTRQVGAVLIIGRAIRRLALCKPHLQCKCYRSDDTLNSLYQYAVIQGLWALIKKKIKNYNDAMMVWVFSAMFATRHFAMYSVVKISLLGTLYKRYWFSPDRAVRLQCELITQLSLKQWVIIIAYLIILWNGRGTTFAWAVKCQVRVLCRDLKRPVETL